MFVYSARMHVAVPAIDRLVDAIDCGGALSLTDAARIVFAAETFSSALAARLLPPLLERDTRCLVVGDVVIPAVEDDPTIDDAVFIVLDLETTGLVAGRSSICEIGAVALEQGAISRTFETIVSRAGTVPRLASRDPEFADEDFRGAPKIGEAIDAFCRFAGDDHLVAHNARFDVSFLNHELGYAHGTRLHRPTLDSLALARALLKGRVESLSLASLASFFGVTATPSHRALPDAYATAEVLTALIEIARDDRGIRSVGDLHELARPLGRLG